MSDIFLPTSIQLFEALVEARKLIHQLYQVQHPEERAWSEFEKNDCQMHIINTAILSAKQNSEVREDGEKYVMTAGTK